ncbi:MAG: Glu-tRNA(Gln) amidotransferase GatDE subunit D, partial [Thermofilaceae archaeon]
MSLEGYGDQAVKLLDSAGASLFDEVELERDDGVVVCGIVLPRPQYGDPDILVLKLPNGYNVGVDARRVKSIRRLGRAEPSRGALPPPPSLKPGLPKVHFIGTGGTI